MSEKYQCTFTGMTPTTIENGPMRYVREVDYDLLQAKIEELETRNRERKQRNIAMLLAALESGNRNYQAEVDGLWEKVDELQAKVEELTGELSIWKRRYNELYEAGIKLTSEYKKRAALKQEGCYEDIDIRL